MSNVLIHGNPDDERVVAYAKQREAAGDAIDYALGDDDLFDDCDEVVISAELESVNAIAAAYKAKGVKVTTLGKRAEVEDVNE